MDFFSSGHSGALLHLVIFTALIAGAVGFPIPEDLPLLAAGIAAHQQSLNIWVAYIVCYAGVFIGDLMIFSFGKKLGPAIFASSWVQKRIKADNLEALRDRIEKRSLLTIFIARHLFYLRTVTFLTCGAINISYKRFIIADAIAALISVPAMISLGYYFSEKIPSVIQTLQQAKWLTVGLVLGLICFIILRRRKASNSNHF